MEQTTEKNDKFMEKRDIYIPRQRVNIIRFNEC